MLFIRHDISFKAYCSETLSLVLDGRSLEDFTVIFMVTFGP